jgi:hypothetical protein
MVFTISELGMQTKNFTFYKKFQFVIQNSLKIGKTTFLALNLTRNHENTEGIAKFNSKSEKINVSMVVKYCLPMSSNFWHRFY